MSVYSLPSFIEAVIKVVVAACSSCNLVQGNPVGYSSLASYSEQVAS